ncbi:zinc-dependent metalloprotease family protein [Haloferax volcanii]|uniref:zinc-dependent metalloprotease family protein n=1 Tax=Haloferax volcanii TaxID=2246 RepID=UPI00349FAA5A
MRGSTLLVAVLVVLAGCAAPVSPGTDGTTATTATSAASPPTTDSATESPAATATPTTSPPSTTATVTPTAAPTESPTPEPTTAFTPAPGYGPWGSEPVVVAVEAPDDGRDYAALVSEATAFWEGNDSRYLEYEIDYEVDADARDPDLVVRFTDDIPECSGLDDAAGCAPYLTDAWQIDRPETVYVRTGYGDDSTVDIVAHELGHTLGLAHGDEPAELMNATGILYTLPRTNATEKAFPWDDPKFTVHIDDTNASDPDAAREQVRHALDYFEGGAPGMPDNLTYTYVDDPADAEVRISFADSSPCAAGAASCAIAGGYDPDGDGALETYGSYRVVLVDLDTEAVGWHVGYWTAHYLGAEADDDKPEPFRNATYGERRSEWWA